MWYEQLSIRIVRTAIDRGINFPDNCWDYNEGTGEVRALLTLIEDCVPRVIWRTTILFMQPGLTFVVDQAEK